MRHVQSQQITDLAKIYREDVELVSIQRHELSALKPLVDELLSDRHHLELQWEQTSADAEVAFKQLRSSMGDIAAQALSEEIATASDVMGELLDCRQVGVRVATLSSPMCPRFHVDQVPCRLISTICGPGTELIAYNDVDYDLLGSRVTDDPPLKSGGTIQILASGCWSVMKGGRWQERFTGVVHRSPHQRGDRLLLSFDPIFP